MPKINIYLTFNGNCRDAFEFYKSVFGGEFQNLSTFGEMPPQEEMPPIDEEMKNNLMHVALPISEGTVLMGSDTGNWGPEISVGNNFSISVDTGSNEEADKLFKALSEGGNITMPMENTFWGSYFGMLTDKFGINWMVSHDTQQHD